MCEVQERKLNNQVSWRMYAYEQKGYLWSIYRKKKNKTRGAEEEYEKVCTRAALGDSCRDKVYSNDHWHW